MSAAAADRRRPARHGRHQGGRPGQGRRVLHHHDRRRRRRARPDDLRRSAPGPAIVVILSGPIAEHGMAIMAARADLELETPVASDYGAAARAGAGHARAPAADDPLPARSDARRRRHRAERDRAAVGRRHRARRGGHRRARAGARRVRAARARSALRRQRGQAARRGARRRTPIGCSTRMRRQPEGRDARVIGEVVADSAAAGRAEDRASAGAGSSTCCREISSRASASAQRGAKRHGGRGARGHQGRAAVRSRRRSRRPSRERLPLGPLKTIHVYWLAGMSCDGCTISVAGATNPGIEGLLAGAVPAMPKVILHHPVLSVEAGAEFVKSFRDACGRQARARPTSSCSRARWPTSGSPARTGGYFSAMGVEAIADGEGSQPGADRHVAAAPGARRGGDDRHRHLRHVGRRPVGRGQSHRRDERHGLPRQGLPERLRPAGHQHPGLRAAGRQLHRDGLRRPAVPAGPRSAADLRRARAGRRGSSATRCTRAARAPASTRRASSPSTTAIPSASSRSAAGGRSSTATSCSAAPSTTWAAA